jgi:hypothetical protein
MPYRRKYKQNGAIVLAVQALLPVNCLATHRTAIYPASSVVLVQKDRTPRIR